MNFEILSVFFVGMLILAASPGPGVVASVSRVLSSGFKASLFVIAGLAAGDVIFLMMALIGMSTISTLLGNFFFIIRITGGLYLMYLGYTHFRSKDQLVAASSVQKESNYKIMGSGFLITLGNPKPIIFYASIVPTIIDIRKVHLSEALLMAAIIVSVSFLVLGTYCYFASLSRKLISDQKANAYINRVGGFLMFTTGLYIVLKN
jgi:threonine/homoserine/homoserine lactone efflux protein